MQTKAIFRFTIRDLLWLTVVVAGFLAWWYERREHVAFKHKFEVLADVLLNLGHEVRSSNPGTLEVFDKKTHNRIQINLGQYRRSDFN